MQRFAVSRFIACLLLFIMWGMPLKTSAGTVTSTVGEIITSVGKKTEVQQSKVKDYVRILNSRIQEKDKAGNVESTTLLEKKTYFKQPDKEKQEFIQATKNGKPMSEKDLQPGMLAASFKKPATELAEEILKELKAVIQLSPSCTNNFDFKLLREDTSGSVKTWVIEATSKSTALKVKKAILWIDQEKMRVVRLEAESIGNPSTFVKSIRVSTDLSEVAPGIFLPKTTKIETNLSKVSSKRLETLNEYSHYQLNVGIADTLFEKKGEE